MDERRFRLALDTIEETIRDYGEETIFAALGVIADRFGWELAKRDPGPDCCDYGRYYADRGVMYPVHECPSEAPDAWVDDLKPEMRNVVKVLMGEGVMIDFTDGTWVRDFSDVNRRRQKCGCSIVYVGGAGTRPPGWMWSHRCDEHKQAS